MSSGGMVAMLTYISRRTRAIITLPVFTHGQRMLTTATTIALSSSYGKVVNNDITVPDKKCEHILILGGGIAGLATARFLLHYSERQNMNDLKVTIIDRNSDILTAANSTPSCYSPSEKRLHKNIPSRRNGNVLCPSLTVPWTARSLWSEAIFPGMKSFVYSSEPSPAVTFDLPSLISDKDMWSFGAHFFLQKFLLGCSEQQSNKSILDYSMKCLDDPSDDLVRSIEYGRCALGTQLLDGTVIDGDSSGDIGLFCQGLLHRLINTFDRDKLMIIPGEEASVLHTNDGVLHGVTTIDQFGEKRLRVADKIVVALGVNSSSLCKSIDVPCPVYPVKGHLVTVASKVDKKYNLTLDGGVGYAAPMSHVDAEGRHLYRLSGFVDFTRNKEVDRHRVDALIRATRLYLPDAELIDASACHRPISADDRALIGPAVKFPNLFLCTGFGSRGWTIGVGSGKILASQILGVPCDIDPAPYLPSRFKLSFK